MTWALAGPGPPSSPPPEFWSVELNPVLLELLLESSVHLFQGKEAAVVSTLFTLLRKGASPWEGHASRRDNKINSSWFLSCIHIPHSLKEDREELCGIAMRALTLIYR